MLVEIIMGVAVEDQVGVAPPNGDSRPHIVVRVEELENIVASGDVNAPALVVFVVVLRNAPEFEAFDMDPASGHVNAPDPAIVRDFVKIENGRFAGVGHVMDRFSRRAAFIKRDGVDVAGLAAAGAYCFRIGVGPRPEKNGVARRGRALAFRL